MARTATQVTDKLLGILEVQKTVVPVIGRKLSGTQKTDFLFGTEVSSTLSGKSGNDVIVGRDGNDKLSGDLGGDMLFGGAGNDRLDGGSGQNFLYGQVGNDALTGGSGVDLLDGGSGVDVITGGAGNDILVGGSGVDTITGGTGQDEFRYEGNAFANGTPTLVAAAGIKVLNQPDVISDFNVGEDRIALDGADLNLTGLSFQKAASASLTGDSNAIVLLNSFAAAGAAAKAIADNANVTAKEGVFAYFNTTLGITRVVYSKDLANGGDISVLANLNNQSGATGLANLANFSASQFALV